MDSNKFAEWLHQQKIVSSSISNETGGILWLEEGIKIKKKFVQLVLDSFFEYNYKQIELPLFIENEVFRKQPQHYEGLNPISYRVISPDFESTFVLRSTSETPFTYLFRELRYDFPLPLKYIQNVSVFRLEEKDRLFPLLRTREINPFIETYTLLENEDFAKKQIEEEIEIYSTIIKKLDVPFLLNKRPKFDTFPEAKYTIAFDVIIPGGQIFQICTVHNLGNSFCQAFGIKKVEADYYTQTSTGISSRAIGCSLIIHQEKSIMQLPSAMSPYIFLLSAGDKLSHNITSYLENDLSERQLLTVKTNITDKDINNWFNKGGCFYTAISNENLEIISRFGNSYVVHYKEFNKHKNKILNEYNSTLYKNAQEIARKHIFSSENLENIDFSIPNSIYEIPLCDNEKCLVHLQEFISPHGKVLGIAQDKTTNQKCCGCKNTGNRSIARIAIGKIDHH